MTSDNISNRHALGSSDIGIFELFYLLQAWWRRGVMLVLLGGAIGAGYSYTVELKTID